MYKKSREQFMQQLRTIRKQLHQKLNNNTPQQTHLDRLMLARQNLSSLQYQVPQRYALAPKYKAFQFKHDIPTPRNRVRNPTPQYSRKRSSEQNQELFYENIQQKLKQYQQLVKMHKKQSKPIRSTRSNGVIRLKSLPSKPISRSNTTQPEQISFQPFFLQLSSHRQKRTDSQLRQAYAHLHQNNKLFEKLDPYLSLCLLKIGYLHEVNPGTIFYNTNYDKQSIYIMLSGVIALLNSNIGLKKLVFTGQTFGEQMLFGSSPTRTLLEQAKSIAKSYVLQIKISDFTVLYDQSRKLGYARQFDRFEDFLRDGFTDKNLARNQHLIHRKIRMSS